MLKTVIDGEVLNVPVDSKGNGETYYYYFDLNGSGLDAFFMQHFILNTTLTYEASNSSNAADWQDITDGVSGGAVSSYTTSGYVNAGTPVVAARIRVKAVTTDASNSLRLVLARKKL